MCEEWSLYSEAEHFTFRLWTASDKQARSRAHYLEKRVYSRGQKGNCETINKL